MEATAKPKSKSKMIVIVIIVLIGIGTAIMSYRSYQKSKCGQPGHPAC